MRLNDSLCGFHYVSHIYHQTSKHMLVALIVRPTKYCYWETH